MAADPTKLLVPATDFRFLYNEYGAGAIPSMPANTVAGMTGTWGTGWVDPGGTEGGVALAMGRATEDVMLDQLFDPAYILDTGRDIRLSTLLGESSAENLKASQGYGTITTVAAISGTRGNVDLAIPAGAPGSTNTAAGFEARQRNGEYFRGLFYSVRPVPTGDMRIIKNNKATIPVSYRAIAPASGNVGLLRWITPALP